MGQRESSIDNYYSVVIYIYSASFRAIASRVLYQTSCVVAVPDGPDSSAVGNKCSYFVEMITRLSWRLTNRRERQRLFTAHELHRTDLQQVDPVTRRVHGERVPIQLAQCRFPGVATSSAKI